MNDWQYLILLSALMLLRAEIASTRICETRLERDKKKTAVDSSIIAMVGFAFFALVAFIMGKLP